MSPGGFHFGLQGWSWGEPIPKSITFFLDGSAMVCDQHGRPIRTVLSDDGRVLRFADGPPAADREGRVVPRPQFATHQEVVAALTAEHIDWLSYTVKYKLGDGSVKSRSGLTKEAADKLFNQLMKENFGNAQPVVDRTIACSGWPQLPYDELKKLPELPPTPDEELRKICDHQLRRDARRIRSETDSARAKETQEND